MIDELKMVLDAVGDLTGVALWVVGGFIAFKLITYLATTGSVVFILKLAIEKLHDSITQEKRVITEVHIDDIVLSEQSGIRIRDALRRCTRGDRQFLHSEDVVWICDAIKDARKRREG